MDKWDERFMELIRELYQVYEEKACGSAMRMMSVFYDILYYLVRDYRLPETRQDFVRKNKTLDRLSRITSYMKDNYRNSLSLERVAEEFGYSPTYLSRMFQKYAGITFKDHLQNIRLGHAVKDLEKGECSITEAAIRNGISGSKALARAFRKKYGMLPSEYRAEIQRKTGKG